MKHKHLSLCDYTIAHQDVQPINSWLTDFFKDNNIDTEKETFKRSTVKHKHLSLCDYTIAHQDVQPINSWLIDFFKVRGSRI